MAQHFYDFDEFSAGDIATVAAGTFTVQQAGGGNWTQTIVDLGSGDMAARIARTSSGDGLNIVTTDDFEAVGGVDVEVYSEFTVGGAWTVTGNAIGGALARSDNAAYAIYLSAANTFRLAWMGTTGSISANIGSTYTMTAPGAGVVICTRVGCYNRAGTQAVRGKIWLKSGSEPESWLWDAAEGTLSTSLRPALHCRAYPMSPYTFLALGIGTAGDVAPTIGGSTPPTAKIVQMLLAA